MDKEKGDNNMTETERAIRELELAGMFDDDSDYNGGIGKCVKELLLLFGKQGHSGFSASRVSDIFHTLSCGGILTPLSGEPNEWTDVSLYSDILSHFQNKRASHVFAEDNNGLNAYDINGKVFQEPDGSQWTNSDSRVDVTFPYTPSTVIVHVEPNKEVL